MQVSIYAIIRALLNAGFTAEELSYNFKNGWFGGAFTDVLNKYGISPQQFRDLYRNSGITEEDITNIAGSSSSTTSQPFNNGSSNDPFSSNVDPTNGIAGSGLGTYSKDFDYFFNALREGTLTAPGTTALTSEQYDAFFQWLLQQLNNLDQRKYDQQLTNDQRSYEMYRLNEQRGYDNPSAQIARLTAAGMSRDAALMAISGGASAGAGAGAVMSAPVQGTPAVAPGVPAPSGSSDMQLAGTILSGVQTLVSMVQAGFDMAASIEAIKSANMANQLTEKQLKAFTSTDEVASYLQNLSANHPDIYATVNGFDNAEDVLSYIEEHKDTNAFAPLVASPSFNQTFGTQTGRRLFNEHWARKRESKKGGDLFNMFYKQQSLQNELARLNIDKVGEEIANFAQDTDLKFVQMRQKVLENMGLNENLAYLEESHAYRVAQEEFKANTMYFESESAYYNSSALARDFTISEEGFPMLKESKIRELQYTLNYWRTITDETALENAKLAWYNESENKWIHSYLDNMYLNACSGYATKYPDMWSLLSAWKYTNMSDVIGGAAQGARAVNGALGTLVKPLTPFH